MLITLIFTLHLQDAFTFTLSLFFDGALLMLMPQDAAPEILPLFRRMSTSHLLIFRYR